jgi:hypothetical protein
MFEQIIKVCITNSAPSTVDYWYACLEYTVNWLIIADSWAGFTHAKNLCSPSEAS